MIIVHSDSGHAWLEVTENQMSDVGLSPNDISGFSYFQFPTNLTGVKDGVIFYLEEDEDGSKFDLAFRERNGHAPSYHASPVYGDSFIRSLERLDSARKRWGLEL